MSRSNKNETQYQSKREDRKRFITRLFCLFMALLMVAGVAYYAIFFIASSLKVGAAAVKAPGTFSTAPLKEDTDYIVSVGLSYGNDVTYGFEIKSSTGFELGMQWMDGDRDFETIWSLRDTKVSCTSDMNLSKSGMTYSEASSTGNTVIGGYHIQIDCDNFTKREFEDFVSEEGNKIWRLGLSLIPSYIYNGYAVRVGHFPTRDRALTYLDTIKELFPEHYVSIVSPTDTAVSVVDPNTDDVLFEFDGYGRYELGFRAYEDRVGNTYITTPAGNVYDGVFAFKRFDNGKVDGVSLVNIVPIDAYTAGVVPFETSNDWPIEAQKAFSIVVRSFTLTSNTKHKNYGFDICNTVCCQVYKGAGRINSTLMEAILSTSGQVVLSGNTIAQTLYSSSVGGVTVSVKDVWGTDLPYLKATETPWENYMDPTRPRGFWTTEVSPEDLLKRLNEVGHKSLRGEIKDVRILEFAENSTYIKKLQVVDSYGTSVTITNTDKVRTALSPYVYSANFVIGKGSVEYTEGVFIENSGSNNGGNNDNGNNNDYNDDYVDDNSPEKTSLSRFTVISAEKTQRVTVASSKTVRILTGDGVVAQRNKNVYVATAKSGVSGRSSATVLTADNARTVDAEVLSASRAGDVVRKTAYASNRNNFIIVGKGWGHGTGISQWGIYDLSRLGYTHEDILSTYFYGTTIGYYRTANNFR